MGQERIWDRTILSDLIWKVRSLMPCRLSLAHSQSWTQSESSDWDNTFLNGCPLDRLQSSQTPREMETQKSPLPWSPLFSFVYSSAFLSEPQLPTALLLWQAREATSFLASEPGKTRAHADPRGRWCGLQKGSPEKKPASLLLKLITSHSNPDVLLWKRPPPRDENGRMKCWEGYM